MPATTAGAGYICGCGTRYDLAAGASTEEQLWFAAACDDHDEYCEVARSGLTAPDPVVSPSPMQAALARARTIVATVEAAGVRVQSLDIWPEHVDVLVEPGMVAAAAFELGWSAAHEVTERQEYVQEAESRSYRTSKVYGAVSG